MCTEKDIPEYDYWQYVQYPCPLRDLPIILRRIVSSWEKVMDFGSQVRPTAKVCRAIDEMKAQILVSDVKWPYFLWMDQNGRLHFFHFPYEKNQMYQFSFPDFFAAGMPAAILDFMETGDTCTVCTIYPFEDDLRMGKMYSRGVALDLFPEFRQLNHLMALTNFRGDTSSICDGVVTNVVGASGPEQYFCFWAWSDYIYVVSHTEPALINFINWVIGTAKRNYTVEEFDTMMSGIKVWEKDIQYQSMKQMSQPGALSKLAQPRDE